MPEKGKSTSASSRMWNRQNGDPGAGGCLNAGLLADKQGDTQRAIDILRLSKFSDAQMKADELERRLNDMP